MRIRSLQQRTLLLILLPIFGLLLLMSVAGYVSVRQVLINQWGDATSVKLQSTAHQIDMRLRQPKELLKLISSGETGAVDRKMLTYLFQKLEGLEAVSAVNVSWPGGLEPMEDSGVMQRMMVMHRLRFGEFALSPPVYNKRLNNRTVSLVSTFRNVGSSAAGRIEVVISFDRLIDVVTGAGWWKSNDAYIVDNEGHVLAKTENGVIEDGGQMFDTSDPLKKATLSQLSTHASGMVFSSRLAPERVSGYFRLQEAPWSMVLIAPATTVLAPIIRFRNLYIIAISFAILGILMVLRAVTGSITSRIEDVSTAADNLARGRFGPPLEVTGEDEVGILTRSFNTMSRQLKQRLSLQEAFGVAREVQQNLLPQECYIDSFLQVRGVSLYCDETGGDYFDIIPLPDESRVVVIVGDVVGHGIGAALLMTTVRALVRARLFGGDDLKDAMDTVNRILCRDTARNGNFVTLFGLEIDNRRRTISWVRCGHDPAMVYCPESDASHQLRGEGIAMGVDPDREYEVSVLPFPCTPQVILLASDGAWEVENEAGQQFGRERLQFVLARESEGDADAILESMVGEIRDFAGNRPREDDITLVVVKVN